MPQQKEEVSKDLQKWDERHPEGQLPEKPSDRSISKAVILAIESGYGTELIEKMMDLQERHERNEAKKAYVEAMAAFKANPPEIDKDRHVSYQTSKGVTEYNHASLGNVTDKINKSLGEHGLSSAWATNQDEKRITVTCTITHRLGHSESTQLSAHPDDSGGKNSIQAIGSTISYLQRYTLLALTGLATFDQDDDGQSSETIYISTDQQTEIIDLMEFLYADKGEGFLKWLKVDSVEEIPVDQYKKVISALQAVKKGGAK